jgi:hypothetical protein
VKYKYQKIAALILFVFIGLECHAQHVTGKITDDQGNPIAYAYIVLKTMADSVLDGTISDDNGLFVFIKLYELPLIVEASFVGYTTWSEKINELPIQQITLFSDENWLDEVIIMGKKQKIIENINGVLSINVSKSFLKDESNIYSLLAKVPGVKVANESIALFGKQNLAIYIDDRKVLSDEEYHMLAPSDILRVEIIRNPGAEYDAGVDAVLKIYTNRSRFIKNTSLNLSNNTSVNQGISNSISTAINHSRELISQTFKYNYGYSSGIRQQDINRTYNYLPNYTNLGIRDVISENSRIRHSIFYGLALRLSDKTDFGVQYTGSIRDTKTTGDGVLDIFHDELKTSNVQLNARNDLETPLSNFSLNLNHEITPGLRFYFVGDYAYTHNIMLNYVEEDKKNEGFRINENRSKNKYHIFSTNPYVRYSVENVTLTSGIRISDMKSRSDIWYGNSNSNEKIWQADFVGAAYTQVAIKTKPLDFNLGIRGEWAESEQHGSAQNEVSKIYKNLFPYASVGKNIGDDLDLTLRYRKSLNRPRISHLDPTYIYRDTLTYLSGNPHLRPETSDMSDLTMQFKSFGIEIGYYRFKDTYYIMDLQDENNPVIMNSTYGNLDKANTVLHAGLSHSFNSKLLSTMVSIMVDKPYTQVLFLGDYISKNKETWYFQAYVNANLTKKLSLAGAYFYNSKGDYKDMRYQDYSSFDLGLNLHLLEKTLLVSINIDDVFHTNYSNSFISESNNIRYIMHSIPDSRIFSFSMRYVFGGKTKEVRETSSSSEIRRRVE